MVDLIIIIILIILAIYAQKNMKQAKIWSLSRFVSLLLHFSSTLVAA